MVKRSRRTPEQQIADLEAQIEALRERKRAEGKVTPEAVLADRERLQLSRADYAELVGVSPLTIYHWETGHSQPRRAQIEKWLAVKGIGKRKAWSRLGIE